MPASVDVAGPSLDQAERKDDTIEAAESSESSSEEEEADEGVGLAGGVEENGHERQATEQLQASVQTQDG